MQAYRALFMKWYPDKHSPAPSPKQEAEPKLKPVTETYEGIFSKKKLKSLRLYGFGFASRKNDDKGGSTKGASAKGGTAKGVKGDNGTAAPVTGKDHQKTNDAGLFSNLSRSTSTRDGNRSQPSNFSRSTSTRDGGALKHQHKDGNPIRFSYSAVRKKPPPMEKPLKCTLEDLCHGCVKKITLTRDVLADTGLMVEEQELLCIKVKPGWRKGTKITFEGIGDERPGMLPADVIFSIVEEEHPLFKREGNDLVLSLGVSLVDALTGCLLSIPLLGGENMNCWIDDIIYPGYEKIIAGQGMPIPHENGKRGDLQIRFQVEFPTKLREKQRSDLFSLLQDAP
ncbi:dnaJ subfamily B member 13-like protein [Cinnamomum micranthum f. kanehirae]|uniref:DnaJ subfamily B member 13-like protein n=1 Tax=Cinnamomum micranthum f. kanehirae TaxID=337451 RepID=A0A443Q4T5_9MAGN|nr:dnaJ subfamily B member 13-like protein [Cinnamomum micranthum f. kanehirae]